eukprot:CAMPEP_0197541054 /NCGR_PEP_ID=MMETSP1318-20131121/66947_1 /TAXON_ID=552666 /ORGANISM="Partenskyella glossopodia, Strain RCC365" /LENGTH=533 /DNA_ID=CAMNT_0043100187 /DNA_START=307 /DNA_END=1908 /DNA_ORIENTATION=-
MEALRQMAQAKTPKNGQPAPTTPSRRQSLFNMVGRQSLRRRRTVNAFRSRWLILGLVCLVPFGSHFVRKELGPLKTAMLGDKEFGLSNTTFAMLLSATALPNLLVPIFGGALLDMRGSRLGTMLFLMITVFAQILFVTMAGFKNLGGCLVAQILVGIGAGSTVVSQGAITSQYFQGTEMGLAIGIIESTHNMANWMGQALPSQISHMFGEGYTPALWAGVIACIVSLLAGILYIKLDKRAEEDTSAPHRVVDRVVGDESVIHKNEGLCCVCVEETEKIPRTFFALAFLHLLFSTAHETFDSLSANLITERYGTNPVDAGLLASIDNVFGLILAPVIGIIMDRMGHRLHIIMFMALVLSIAQLMLGMLSLNPIWSLCLLSVVNCSVPTILRSSVPRLVDPDSWGTAFGIYEAFEALGTFSGNLVAGYLRDLTKSYVIVNLGFSVFGLLCFGVAWAIMMEKEAAWLLKIPLRYEGSGSCDGCDEEGTGVLDPTPRPAFGRASYGSIGEHKPVGSRPSCGTVGTSSTETPGDEQNL